MDGFSGEAFTALVGSLRRREHLGLETVPGGGLRICRTPTVAPQAWLHIVYPPLDEADIADLERDFGGLPRSYCDLLARANGLNLFSDHLAIYGVRSNYQRAPSVIQPYDLRLHAREVPGRVPGDMALVGSLYEDGSQIWVGRSDGSVVRSRYDRWEPLNRWTSLEEFLFAEIERLEMYFGPEGDLLDVAVTTLPEPGTGL